MKILGSSELTSATYDQWESDKLDTAREVERGGNPEVNPPHDYNELFPRSPGKPKHQQEQWWRRKKDKDEVGGEGDSPTPTPFMDGSPTDVNAFPMTGSLISSSVAAGISVSMEFTKEGLRATVTWDKEDIPPGLSEEQTLAKIVQFLQANVPPAITSFKNVQMENVDLANRIVSLRSQDATEAAALTTVAADSMVSELLARMTKLKVFIAKHKPNDPELDAPKAELAKLEEQLAEAIGMNPVPKVHHE